MHILPDHTHTVDILSLIDQDLSHCVAEGQWIGVHHLCLHAFSVLLTPSLRFSKVVPNIWWKRSALESNKDS
jgi:hypothetical protein